MFATYRFNVACLLISGALFRKICASNASSSKRIQVVRLRVNTTYLEGSGQPTYASDLHVYNFELLMMAKVLQSHEGRATVIVLRCSTLD